MRQQLSIPPAGNSWDSKEILDVSLLHGAIWISEFLKRGHLKEQRWRISGWVCGLWELGLTCPFNPPPTSLIPVRVTSLPDLSSRVQGRLRGMPLRCRASQGPGISLWFRMRAAFIVFMENPDVFELETMLMELARDGGKGSWSVREVRFMVLRFSGTLTGALREESSKLKWVCCNWDCILRSNRLGASGESREEEKKEEKAQRKEKRKRRGVAPGEASVHVDRHTKGGSLPSFHSPPVSHTRVSCLPMATADWSTRGTHEPKCMDTYTFYLSSPPGAKAIPEEDATTVWARKWSSGFEVSRWNLRICPVLNAQGTSDSCDHDLSRNQELVA